MSLSETLDIQFENFQIKSPDPKQDHPWHKSHLHADFIELRCLFWSKKDFITIQDCITFYKDYDLKIADSESKNFEDLASSMRSEINDKWVEKFSDVWDVLIERHLIYGDAYPFTVSENKIRLNETQNPSSKVYIFLLLSSNLNNFPLLKHFLTSDFEAISAKVLSNYLPDFKVAEFGINSAYKGNTITKIKSLSSTLELPIRKSLVLKISKLANKEKGLDIIAHKKFEDQIANMIVILIQCACGKKWESKKGETGNYESYLDFIRLKPIHSMFIPYGLVRDNEDFEQDIDTNGCLMFERKRIIDFFKTENISDYQSFKIVERCLLHEFIEV